MGIVYLLIRSMNTPIYIKDPSEAEQMQCTEPKANMPVISFKLNHILLFHMLYLRFLVLSHASISAPWMSKKCYPFFRRDNNQRLKSIVNIVKKAYSVSEIS